MLGRAYEGLGLHVFVKVVTCICQISYTYVCFLTNGRVECSVWHLRGLGGLRVPGQSEEANPWCTFVALPPAAIFCQHHLNHLDSPESQGVWTSVAIFRYRDAMTVLCVTLYQNWSQFNPILYEEFAPFLRNGAQNVPSVKSSLTAIWSYLYPLLAHLFCCFS